LQLEDSTKSIGTCESASCIRVASFFVTSRQSQWNVWVNSAQQRSEQCYKNRRQNNL